jgi:PAS domain S-box-containing protein
VPKRGERLFPATMAAIVAVAVIDFGLHRFGDGWHRPMLVVLAGALGASALCGWIGMRRARESERARRHAEMLYHAYWWNAQEALFVYEVTRDGRFILEGLNPTHERLSGLEAARCRGKEPHEFLPPDVTQIVTAHYRRCLERAAPIHYEEVLAFANGTRQWETSLVPVAGPDGRVIRILGCCREITQRNRTLDALRASEDRFRAVAQTVPAILFSASPSASCDYLSPRFYQVTGMKLGAAAGHGWIRALHPTGARRIHDAMRHAGAIGDPFEDEYRIRGADGDYRWFVIRARSVRDDAGQVVKWYGAATDIDEFKRTQQALSRSNERLEAILASIGDCYLTLDRDWRVTAANPQAARFFDGSVAALIGKRVWDVMPATGHGITEEMYRLARDEDRRVEFEAEWVPQAGRWIEHHVYPGRGTEELAVFFQDITGRKLAEFAARDTQALLQSTMDALSTQIAILDRRGVVIAANAAWLRFGAAAPASDRCCGVGISYFDYWENACETSTDAIAVLSGLLSVLKGAREEFRHEYPSGDDDAALWFQLRVSRFGRGDALKLVIAHEDVTEVKRSEERLRLLTRRTVRLQDEERRRIARELHDSTAQNLLGATLGIYRAKRLLPELSPEAAKALDDSCDLIEQSQREIRTTAYLLHPPMLDEAGLPTALQWYIDGFVKRSGIAVDLSIAPEIENHRLPYEVETALFRVVQEALTNVHRHSGSQTARVALACPPDKGFPGVVLTVEDEGRGIAGLWSEGRFDVASDGGSLRGLGGVGLVGMSERLRQLNGYLRIRSRPGNTEISAVVRLDGQE